MGSEPRNILKIFLKFTDFEAHYSYKIYSYKKKSVVSYLSENHDLFSVLKANKYFSRIFMRCLEERLKNTKS